GVGRALGQPVQDAQRPDVLARQTRPAPQTRPLRMTADCSGSSSNSCQNHFSNDVDKKSQMQALHRSQPVLPMMPGTCERAPMTTCPHDYAPPGVATLSAALDTATTQAITSFQRRDRTVATTYFLGNTARH